MDRPDLTTRQEWLSLELDGALGSEEQGLLDEMIAEDEALAAERRSLTRLSSLLEESREPVSRGFAQNVMNALPSAGWEARHPRNWSVAVGVLLALGTLSAALVGTGSARVTAAGSFVAALAAVADMMQTTALAGAGMMAASWKGLGLALGQMVAASTAALLVLGFLVLCLNLLFFSLWRSTSRAITAAVPVGSSADSPSRTRGPR